MSLAAKDTDFRYSFSPFSLYTRKLLFENKDEWTLIFLPRGNLAKIREYKIS